MIAITVPGRPVPLGRHRHGSHGNYLPSRSRIYRETIQAEWMLAGRPTLTDQPFAATMRFVGLRANADIDNAAKAILDALNNLAYLDDRQCTALHVEKRPTDKDGPRAEIQLSVTRGT
jgi:crossover junction endodeoxyribonuclease RusA